jgi:transposase
VVANSDAQARCWLANVGLSHCCQCYGTILVDWERHCVIDLLPNREATSLAYWFRAHSEVEFISSDRSSTYAEGDVKGSSEAVQVADR